MNKNSKKEVINTSVKSGITFGSALAMVISYAIGIQLFGHIIHGLISWNMLFIIFLNIYKININLED